MILYHGTNQAFDTIDLTKSKPNKDFGQGFYLSEFEATKAAMFANGELTEEQIAHGAATHFRTAY